MNELITIASQTFLGNAQWIWGNIMFDVPWTQNYFWGLTFLSLFVWGLEIMFPWRKQQRVFRHEFWLDGFYMYFNFFIFSLAINVVYALIAFSLGNVGLNIQSLALFSLQDWHPVIQILVFFVLLDFLQWVTHYTLHHVSFLWRFHHIHHTIKEMGFAGHLRYHWMENVLYKPLKTLGIMLIGGFEPEQAFMVHFFTITIGHLNHANLKWDYGVLKYVFNNPVMHLYHHAYDLPEKHPNGMNFALTLSVWDYLFGTAYVPDKNGEIRIGIPDEDIVSGNFFKQLVYGFRTK